jgi:NAD(P)-dependent dehydrogenase (short-subunit alcohol dehydrogenase family)
MKTQTPKTALITGAGKRIGRALALDLASHGWAIGVHYATSAEPARALVAEIEQAGGKAHAVQADLAHADAVEAIFPEVIKAIGPIGLLINSASQFERDTVHSLTAQSWDSHININLRAPALLMRDFANQDIFKAGDAAAQNGCIINLTDQRVWRLTPDFASYTVSKTGLWTLTQTFAQALAPQHIRVNAIAPGPTVPNPRQQQSEFDKQASLVPLAHGTTPEEIADGVRFILSARAMTGQTIALDGGQHLAWQTPDVVDVKE